MKEKPFDRPYALSYRLVIDAVLAREVFDRIAIVTEHGDKLQLCFCIHQAGKKIDFILPDGCINTDFFRYADDVLDFKMNNYVMEVIE